MRPLRSNQPIRSPVLIGRERESALLGALIERVKQRHGQTLLLSGEAGIGKSRLLAEGKRQADEQGFLVLQGACFPPDRTSPYAPLLDLLSSSHIQKRLSLSAPHAGLLTHELARLFPGFLEHTAGFPPSPAPTIEPEREKRRLFIALSQFFMGEASTRPVLLTIEDVHWSDETSLEFLHYLARSSVAHPLLLVVTYRNDEMHPGLNRWLAQLDRERLAQECLLPPLSKVEVEAMLRAIFDQQQVMPASAIEAIYGLTEGNPFFIEEILKSLILVDASDSPRWENQPLQKLPVPRSVQETVALRLGQLSDAARHVVTLAAVAGRRFDFAVLQQITRLAESELLSLMKELIAAQLVVEESEEQFAFRHALTRQAIYRQLLLREREALHRTLAETEEHLFAETLEAHLTEVAYHFYEARVWEKAFAYAKLAGERALILYAPRVAIEQFTRALKATHYMEATSSAPLYRLRGQAYETLGEFEHARADYERALTTAHDAGQGEVEWQAVIDLGFLWAGRDYERAGSFFREAVQRAAALSQPTLYAHSLNRLGNWLVNTGQTVEGLAAHQQALEVFRRQQDRAGMAQTLDLLGMALVWTGNFVEGRQQQEQAIALFRLLGDKKGLSSILSNASLGIAPATAETAFVLVRSPEECERDTAEAAELARQIDWPAGEAYAELTAGILLASFGQLGKALAHVRKGFHIAQEIEHQQWIVAAYSHFGQISLLLLDPALALHYLESGLRLAKTLGSAWWMDAILSSQALAFLQLGQLKQAEAALQLALAREQEPCTLSQRRVRWAWGELVLAQGEAQGALQIAEHLIASAPGNLTAQPIPRLWKLKGEALAALRRLEEAVEALEEAKRGALLRYETPLLWRIHGALGRVYRLLKREQEASEALMAAREGVELLAQTIDDAELREQFSQRALASLPRARPSALRRVAAASFGGLTEREREVAALIAQGATNREIADLLVISERTAEGHVNAILRKLGFTSRVQIAVWAVERRLTNR
ncbi:helix-turn-helix transcriptional regulator [Thermogemmatispora tikiterensis]|uniref:HTH luxR-type domain-containing protein n=1 Tax=Thermogemmatispora tikiterensis TaxID=1825093 RepID=A0A328VF57_9CHLR|nr:AAA family ATPase [Thermogemmatispora tikiterensis]RAQ94173.1 hypothetical protein A4R35_01420 [Thermogemmatispora tikiterensis]